MLTKPLSITHSNLSLAWAEALLAIRAANGHRLGPLTVTFSGFEEGGIHEVARIRTTLDAALESMVDQPKVHTVANTIFPQSLWRISKGDRGAFYDHYRANLPEYVAMEPHRNLRGLYFGRLIAYDLDHRTGERLAHMPADKRVENCNQLEFIIQHCKPGKRISILQASVFDPVRDHTNAKFLPFPCLQHITFVPDFGSKTIALNAFYATQQVFTKAYGNYLGLARLGQFVASQIGLSLVRVTCFVGVEKMDYKPKQGELMDAVFSACEDAIKSQASERQA